jgi:hypothetical protein
LKSLLRPHSRPRVLPRLASNLFEDFLNSQGPTTSCQSFFIVKVLCFFSAESHRGIKVLLSVASKMAAAFGHAHLATLQADRHKLVEHANALRRRLADSVGSDCQDIGLASSLGRTENDIRVLDDHILARSTPVVTSREDSQESDKIYTGSADTSWHDNKFAQSETSNRSRHTSFCTSPQPNHDQVGPTRAALQCDRNLASDSVGQGQHSESPALRPSDAKPEVTHDNGIKRGTKQEPEIPTTARIPRKHVPEGTDICNAEHENRFVMISGNQVLVSSSDVERKVARADHQPSQFSIVDKLLQTGVTGEPTKKNNFAGRVNGSRSGQSSANGGSRSKNKDNVLKTMNQREKGDICANCDDPRPRGDRMKLRCSHWYCKVCTAYVFESALGGGHRAQCCGHEISRNNARLVLRSELVQKYNQWISKFSSRDPVRCANLCGRIILGEQTKAKQERMCQVCREETCTRCRKARHEGLCKIAGSTKDSGDADAAIGWSNCPSCSRFIELTHGCFKVK